MFQILRLPTAIFSRSQNASAKVLFFASKNKHFGKYLRGTLHKALIISLNFAHFF